MKDSTKNKAPIGPVNSAPTPSSSANPRYTKAPEKGTLVKKTGNIKGATDPYTQAKPSRTKVTATGGARYGIRVKFQQTIAPEAGATQGNGRILPSPRKRQAPSFTEGMVDYN